MTDSRKTTLVVGADTTDAKRGLGEVKAAAQDMAQAVQQAGQKAGEGLRGVGDGAGPASQKLDAATRSIIGSIQRTTAAMEAGSKTGSKYFEVLASQRGANLDALKPYLAQLDAVTTKQAQANGALSEGAKGIDNVGMSAKATTAALRQLPAQFTDIVTGLTSGQKPLNVLIQQGGQIKDTFGGVGAASRALGGYVLGLVNPLTILAGVVGVVAVAAHQGAAELRAFQNAATLTGNAIGLSNSQFAQLRESIGGIATEGKAAEALTAIAESGLSAGQNLRGIAEAAILMEKATGQSIDKTVQQFKELARSPSDAAAKLNEQYNFLTASIYLQIKALEDQGRAVEAANLAESTYADALKTRAQSVVDNAGIIEKAWRGITGTAKSAWDAMLGIGRQVSGGEQLAILQKNLAERQERNRSLGIGDANGDSAATRDIKDQINLLQENERMERRLAESQAARAQITRQAIEWEKQGDEFKTKAQKRDEELTKARIEGQALINAGIITEQQLTERLAGIRQKYNENTGQSEVAAIVARAQERSRYLSQLQAQLASGDFGQTVKTTEGDQLVAKLQQELKTSLTDVARAEKVRALAAAESLAVIDKQVAAQERQNEAVKKAREVLQQQADAVGKQADAIRQQAEGQEAANATFGKSKTAIEEMTLAQLKATAAQVDATDSADPRYIAGLYAKIEAQERYVQALQKAEFLQKDRSLDEALRVSAEEANTMQLELSLVGQTQLVRERIIGQRKVEVELAKELAAIDKLNLGTGSDADAQREQLKTKARAKAQIDSANAANKAIVDEWQRTADSINNSLTDALLRGFESGKGFAQNFRDTLRNMFATLVLRPIIQGIMAPVSGAIGYGVNAVMGGGGSMGGGGVMGLANNAQSAYSLYNNGSTLYTVGSQYAAGTMSAANAAGTIYANATGAGIDGLLATNGAYGTAAAAGAAEGGAAAGAAGAAGAESGLAALGPWGWAALAVIALWQSGAFSGGETRSGAEYTNTDKLRGPSGGEINQGATRQAIQATIDSINASIRSMGGSTSVGTFYSGLESSNAGEGFAYAGAQLSNGAIVGQGGPTMDALEAARMNRRGSMSEQEAAQAFAEELQQATLQALQQSDIKGKLAEYIRSLGDIDYLTGDALKKAYDRVQTAMTQRAQLQAKLDEMTTTSTDTLAKAREAERKQIDETNYDLLDQIYAQQDLATASANLVVAYNNQQQELTASVEALRQYAKTLRAYVQDLAVSNAGTASQRLALASGRFDSTLAAAHGGDAAARSALTGTAGDYLAALKATARSASDYALGVARVSAALSLEAASVDAQATVQQQQLDTAKAQLTALGLINGSVQSFQDAWIAYQAAQGNVEAAKAARTAADATESVIGTTDPNVVAEYLRNQLSKQTRFDFSYGNEPTGFAAGGYHAGGLRLVGEQGPELEVTGPARIYSASETREMLKGMGSGSGEVLRELLAEMKAARMEGRSADVATVGELTRLNSVVKKWDNVGQPPVRTTA